MRATSQVAEPSPSCCTASESGVRSRRCVDRCFATESRIPTAKHCGMFRHEPRGACVRRSGGLARRFRHQTGCGRIRSMASFGELMADPPGLRCRTGDRRSYFGGSMRSVGGQDGSEPVFQPSNGGVTQSNEPPTNPGRFSIRVSANRPGGVSGVPPRARVATAAPHSNVRRRARPARASVAESSS